LEEKTIANNVTYYILFLTMSFLLDKINHSLHKGWFPTTYFTLEVQFVF